MHLAAFDWNCPQHITQRFSEAELARREAIALVASSPNEALYALLAATGD